MHVLILKINTKDTSFQCSVNLILRDTKLAQNKILKKKKESRKNPTKQTPNTAILFAKHEFEAVFSSQGKQRQTTIQIAVYFV